LHAPGQSRSLNIYWIDVEGGAATLIVTPGGESVLIDAGWATEDDRDAKRIVAAMNDAGVTKLDYVIASHYHSDHVNGMPAVARRVPIGQFIDHGENVEQNESSGSKELWKNYLTVSEGKRHTVVPGDKLPLKGIASPSLLLTGKYLVML
jgi:beta-lactamase superfamily II metal-dependent hydrolase